jgi:5'-nucleotidase
MKKYTILITNDDSIDAPGIRKLIALMRQLGDVIVMAPDKPQSGMGHAITVAHPLRMRLIHKEQGYEEYSCSGTPVDCIKIAEKTVIKGKPDLIVSGINHGSNASINVVYSGTIAAAIEGCIEGINSIGFSLDDYSWSADFSHVDEYILKICREVLEKGLPKDTCLNVNIPAQNGSPVKGMMLCRQARASWVESFDARKDPHNKDYYWLTGVFHSDDLAEDTDQWALKNNFVAIVPLHFDLTAHHHLEKLHTYDWKI